MCAGERFDDPIGCLCDQRSHQIVVVIVAGRVDELNHGGRRRKEPQFGFVLSFLMILRRVVQDGPCSPRSREVGIGALPSFQDARDVKRCASYRSISRRSRRRNLRRVFVVASVQERPGYEGGAPSTSPSPALSSIGIASKSVGQSRRTCGCVRRFRFDRSVRLNAFDTFVADSMGFDFYFLQGGRFADESFLVVPGIGGVARRR